MRVIVDHVRTLSFAIADGALPSNEGRGYVLRRILRRAARFGRKLGLEEPFIHTLVPTLTGMMGAVFPELAERKEHVQRVIRSEEESFGRTLNRGIELFDDAVQRLKAEGAKRFPGDDAFKLYDTYGFPIDLTQLMAREAGLEVDNGRFEALMEEQRERARIAGKARLAGSEGEQWQVIRDGEHSLFTGYESLRETSHICQVRRHEDLFQVVLDRTPFYAESGGQIGDTGVLQSGSFRTNVRDTVKEGDRIIHIVEQLPDDLTAEIEAVVDDARRLNIMRNHTSTHLLHAALRSTVGDHARQAGSFVSPDRLRFDFTHFEAVKPEELETIERKVNAKIRENLPVRTELTTFDAARARGAMALFGEKYGDTVRLVSIVGHSNELCGGTHLKSTGQAGYFRIVSEGSIASGVRRIEAVTGETCAELLQEEHRILSELRSMFSLAKVGDLVGQVQKLLEERKSLEKELKRARTEGASADIRGLVDSAAEVNGVRIVAARVQAHSADELKGLGDTLRKQLGRGVGVLGAVIEGKVSIIAVVTDDLVEEKKVQAGKIVGQVAKIVGGGGGGRPHMAQAGGKDPSKLDDALAAVPDIVKAALAG
jgi:alanyl-tRNA synthetase